MTSKKTGARSRAGIATAAALSLLTIFPPAARAQEPAPAPPQTPQTQTLTFEEALRRALEANPATETARAEVRVSEAQLRQLRSSVLPRVELNGSATRNSKRWPLNPTASSATVLPENDWRYDVTLRQPIYAGGRELKAIRQGRLNVTARPRCAPERRGHGRARRVGLSGGGLGRRAARRWSGATWSGRAPPQAVAGILRGRRGDAGGRAAGRDGHEGRGAGHRGGPAEP